MARRPLRRTLLVSAALSAITVFLVWLYIGRYVRSPLPSTLIPVGDDRLPPPHRPPHHYTPSPSPLPSPSPSPPFPPLPPASPSAPTQPGLPVVPEYPWRPDHPTSPASVDLPFEPDTPDAPTPPDDPTMPVDMDSSKSNNNKRPAPRVVLRQGTYVGMTLAASSRYPKAIDAFRGIPFAASTAGKNRFRPPVPLPPQEDPDAPAQRAVAFGHVCPGLGLLDRSTQGEDCLNANIYRPAVGDGDGGVDDGEEAQRGQAMWPGAVATTKTNAKRDNEDTKKGKKKLLPVVVYVHGGAFNGGSGLERNIASFVAWGDEPLIGVSFNYRVGPLGFLPSALTAREGLLNLGLRDQQALFQWVRENIEAFGGDPDNVTLMGVSAGAHSIGHHIMSYAHPLAPPPPFAKAIIESGAATARAVFLPTHPRHLIQFREFLIACGAESVPEHDVFENLRAMPLDAILHASRTVWARYEASVTWPFQPVIDGPYYTTPNATAASHFVTSSHPTTNKNDLEKKQEASSSFPNSIPLIPEAPLEAWKHGRHLRVPVLTGFNTDEGAMFVPPDADTDADFRAFFVELIPGLTAADLDELAALYPDPNSIANPASPYARVPPGFGRQWSRLSAAYGHYAYICPVLQTAHFLSTSEERNSSEIEDEKNDQKKTTTPAPIYVYRFAATGPWGTSNHGDEAALVAHDADALRGMPGLRAASAAMHGAWVRFAASAGTAGTTLPVRWGDKKKDGDGDNDDDDENVIEWPLFASPFSRAEALGVASSSSSSSSSSLSSSAVNAEADEEDQIMVFAAGNDERAGSAAGGKRSPGTPAAAAPLSAVERVACRFWWVRVPLSEGLGNGSGVGAGRITGRRR